MLTRPQSTRPRPETATHCKANALGGKAKAKVAAKVKAADCKAKDLGFKAKAKDFGLKAKTQAEA